MNRKKFIELIKEYGFISTGRITGSHEIFKSDRYDMNFVVPTGNKEIRKGLYWSFMKGIKKHEELQMRS